MREIKRTPRKGSIDAVPEGDGTVSFFEIDDSVAGRPIDGAWIQIDERYVVPEEEIR